MAKAKVMAETKVKAKVEANTIDCGCCKLPPDPDGMNDEYADRARSVVALYCKLSGSEHEGAMFSLLHHLMHLCDRDRRYGCFDQAHGLALHCYAEATTEREWLKN